MGDQQSHENYSAKRKRLTLIIYPKFQLALLVLNLLILFSSYVAVFIFMSRSAVIMKEDATRLGFGGPDHAYNAYLDIHMQYIYIYLAVAMFIAFLISSAATLVLSNKIAGPIIRLKGFFTQVIQGGPQEVQFRKGDFFLELPPIINDAIKGLKK